MAIEDLREIGNVLYERRSDGMLYPVRRVRPDTEARGVPAQDPSLLNVGGIGQRLGLLNQIFNPVEAIGQSMNAGERMMSPNMGVMDRLAALGDMLSGVAGVTGPAVVAGRAGAPAAAAVMEGLLGGSPTQQAVGDTMRAAGRDVVERLNQPGQMPTTYANPIPGLRLSPSERIALSTPAAWRDPKYEKPQWHPISDTSMSIPAREVSPIVQSLGVLEPERAMRIEDLQGRMLTPAYGDRTIAGANILGYDDINFADPVRSQGGRDFMREQGTGLWASEFTPMSRKAKSVRGLLDAGEDPALVYTAMGAQSGDFSTIMRDATLAQFDPTKISEDAAKKFDERMKTLGVTAWPGTKSGKVAEALQNMPGSTRWAVWQEMDKTAYKNAGFPDIGRTRVSITDPELLDVDPFATGLSVGRPTDFLTNEAFTPHPSYEWQIGGGYEGRLGNLPGQLVWRDFFENRRGAGAAPAGDQRAFMMGSPEISQRVDQQMVDEINAYLEAQGR
jgi:hypothetical protein